MPERDLTPICLRCGSDAMIPDAFFYLKDVGSAAKLQVGVHRNPSALMLKGSEHVDVRVQVCGDCGYIETSAANPRALWDAHIDRLSRELDD